MGMFSLPTTLMSEKKLSTAKKATRTRMSCERPKPEACFAEAGTVGVDGAGAMLAEGRERDGGEGAAERPGCARLELATKAMMVR